MLSIKSESRILCAIPCATRRYHDPFCCDEANPSRCSKPIVGKRIDRMAGVRGEVGFLSHVTLDVEKAQAHKASTGGHKDESSQDPQQYHGLEEQAVRLTICGAK